MADAAQLDRARALVAEALEVPVDDVGADASIDTLEAWDSLGHMKIVMRIEETAGRPLETEETLSVFDLDSIATLLAAAA